MAVAFIHLAGNENALKELPNRLKKNLNKVHKSFMDDYLEDLHKYTQGLFRVGGSRGFEGDTMEAVAFRVSNGGKHGYLYIDNKTINGSPDTTYDTAKMLEEGVPEHIVNVYSHPKLTRWVEEHAPFALKSAKLRVGGDNSQVRLGSSKKRYSDFVFWRAMNSVSRHVDKTIQDALELKLTGEPL